VQNFNEPWRYSSRRSRDRYTGLGMLYRWQTYVVRLEIDK